MLENCDDNEDDEEFDWIDLKTNTEFDQGNYI
jgi:hypothetical protein